VGTATVQISGKGKYEGTVTKTFKINPKGTSISKMFRGKRTVTLKWKRQSAKMASSRITGYQIRYSRSSEMTDAKMKTVKGYKHKYKKITKLKAKSKYYIQIRTYKTVSGNNYYSGWSKVRTVKIR
ncbi:MAG: fibronectin type III domain-containing protein, partial [Firmicutes bacterium]|nr:fibronectin type III domain-containing protein [Bacillota bacterium]